MVSSCHMTSASRALRFEGYIITSTIKPVLWLIQMAYFYYLANALTNIDEILKIDFSRIFVI